MSLRGELTDIYQRHGELKPQTVVDEARPKGAPLHGRFEWNDKLAGEAHRREQASRLIREIRIEYSDKAGEHKSVRGFYALRQTGETEREGYAPTEEIAQNPMASLILLRQFKRDLADLKRNYEHLAEFVELMGQAIA